MTIAEAARIQGFAANLLIRGRQMTASSGETLCAIVQDEALLPDASTIAEAQKRVYSIVSARAGSVADPKAVTSFTETESGGRKYEVIRFEESAADAVAWKWLCDVKRRQFA